MRQLAENSPALNAAIVNWVIDAPHCPLNVPPIAERLAEEAWGQLQITGPKNASFLRHACRVRHRRAGARKGLRRGPGCLPNSASQPVPDEKCQLAASGDRAGDFCDDGLPLLVWLELRTSARGVGAPTSRSALATVEILFFRTDHGSWGKKRTGPVVSRSLLSGHFGDSGIVRSSIGGGIEPQRGGALSVEKRQRARGGRALARCCFSSSWQ